MSSKTSTTLNSITEEIQRAYAAVLLQIVHNLEKDQQEELRFYCTGLIPKEIVGTLNILRSLEYAGKISWEDVCFLKQSLHHVGRLDLETDLVAFEIKRDLTLLLDLYARKRIGSETRYRYSSSMEKVSVFLVKVTETVRDRFDLNNITSFVESRKGIKKVLVEFENQIERNLSHSWSKLTLLFVIAGEIIFQALTTDEHRRKLDVLKLCSTTADELCFRMIRLGSWDDFCDHIEERYELVFPQPDSLASDASSLLEKNKIADMVKHFKETNFFL